MPPKDSKEATNAVNNLLSSLESKTPEETINIVAVAN